MSEKQYGWQRKIVYNRGNRSGKDTTQNSAPLMTRLQLKNCNA